MRLFILFLGLATLAASVSVVLIAIKTLPPNRFNGTVVGIVYTMGLACSLWFWDKYTKIK